MPCALGIHGTCGGAWCHSLPAARRLSSPPIPWRRHGSRGQESAAAWAATVLRRGLSADELDRIVDARLGGRPPYRFQERVAASGERVTLVEAGCGNGKTLAAYMWARRHAVGRRLVFCYPTTGTTSAGFQDYLLAQSELERALMHGRASADIEQILDNGTAEEEDLLWIADVLDLWGTKVVACTVDSVLSLLACWRRALAAAPVFAQSAFVFDEVHSYDDQLFGAFLAFLRWTRASCLVMTASLSEARRAAIERACGKPLRPIRGEPEMENAAALPDRAGQPRRRSRMCRSSPKGRAQGPVCRQYRRPCDCSIRPIWSPLGPWRPALPQPLQVRGPGARPG